MPAIPKRKLYSKPKLVDLGSRKVSGWVDLTLKHSSSKTKVVVYERSLKHRQIEIVQHLVKLGLNVEAPLLDRNGNLIVIRQDKTTKTILTKNMGKT
ncbi:MAG: hypothetical protein Q7K42_00980, partial [Candidatus Diapherotrites archaeon]|nr:hypothetical protein [Candidatus Diapherotrites archaeon]